MFCHADVVSCVHHVAVLNAVFCMTCSLLMLVEEARGDHIEEAYSRAGLMTALQVAMNVFIICSGLSAVCELWV